MSGHRVECDGSPGCGCSCRCHVRCGVMLPNVKEPCYRHPGHRWEHRSRYAIENANRSASGTGLRP